jgi:signal transduction histidine kinase
MAVLPALTAGRDEAREPPMPSGSDPGERAMKGGRRTAPLTRRLAPLAPLLALLFFLPPPAPASDAGGVRRVLVIYPASDRQPGNVLFEQGLRHAFDSSGEPVEIYNEYLDTARFPDDEHHRQLAEFLRQKYAGRTIDVVIPAMAPSLDFALKYREEAFPGVPMVHAAVEERELAARRLGPDVVGVPMRLDLAPTLELALRLHPATRRVAVVAGTSRTDAYWEAEARKAFAAYEPNVEFTYLTGLPMDDLLNAVAGLPDGSLVYYLHVQRDGAGRMFAPAEVVERVSAAAHVPVYGHIGSYLGRGIVGGRLMSFEAEGANAGRLALRVLGGEKPESISVPAAGGNAYQFDWRQLRRWGIDEAGLPPGSAVRFREPTFWDVYRWHIIAVVGLCAVEAGLIVALLLQRAYRRRAEAVLRESQGELRALTGRLLQAQETERRRIARELHDDLSQRLALLAVELDLLAQAPPAEAARLRDKVAELTAQVRELSSTVHELSHNLHPSKLEQLGLVACLRGLCQEQAEAHGLRVEFTHQPTPPVPHDTALCLYRIAQEALRNVVKHSGARHARVALGGNGDGVSLQVADDGAGFDSRADGNGGLGLVSMRERLRLVGGTIAIESRPLDGTRIDVHVPLGAAGRAENELQPRPSEI